MKRQCVIFVFLACERLYPFVPLTYHAIGLRQRVKQNASPWSIPRLLSRGPICWLPVLVLTCKVIVQLFITFSTKATIFSLILSIFRPSMSQTCETLSKMFFHVNPAAREVLVVLRSILQYCLLNKQVINAPINPHIPPLWSSCIYL